MTKNWILDFNGTLATSGITWGLRHAFPRLIQEHQLPYDATRFEQAALVAQERGSQETDPRPLLHDLFETMGWPHELEAPLLKDIMTNYQPELFEDALPFLERLRQHGHTICIVSNNPISTDNIQRLDLAHYINHIVTPNSYPGSQPKPHRDLWDQMLNEYPQMQQQPSVVVGDDPWTDGLFAENCNLPCWIIDRMNRFTALHTQKPYQWVQSLLDIPLTDE